MFQIEIPWLLLLIPLPLLCWWMLPNVKHRSMSALNVPFFAAASHWDTTSSQWRMPKGQTSLFFFVWVLLVAALSGPRWVGEPIALKREGHTLMMALDLSGSMQLDDMVLHGRSATRLAVVKAAAKQFVAQRKGDHIGLILFGSRAYLQTPLTADLSSVMERIDDATVGLAGKTTSIGDAIGLAVKRLQDIPVNDRVLILLTDGANNSGVLQPEKAAELAKSSHIKIYTIGLGSQSDPHAMSRLFLGVNPAADLDEDTLEKIAQMTGGRYFRATDPKSLEAIYETINRLETSPQEQAMIYPEKGYAVWPLAFALVLLFYWFGRHVRFQGRTVGVTTIQREKTP